MAKIHGFVYLLVGFIVSIASYKINYERFKIFFYIGLLFIVIGAAKLVINFITKKGENKAPENKINRISQNNLLRRYKYCPRCRNIVRANDRFCSRCGAGV